jgi:hypothetical protein
MKSLHQETLAQWFLFFREETKYRETTDQKAEQKLMSIDPGILGFLLSDHPSSLSSSAHH